MTALMTKICQWALLWQLESGSFTLSAATLNQLILVLQFMRFLEFVPPTLTCVILPILPYNWIILIWHDGIPITVNKITFFGNYGKDERNIEKKQKTLATFCLHNFIFTESQNWSSGLSLECLQTLPIYNSILTRKVVMKLYFFCLHSSISHFPKHYH